MAAMVHVCYLHDQVQHKNLGYDSGNSFLSNAWICLFFYLEPYIAGAYGILWFGVIDFFSVRQVK